MQKPSSSNSLLHNQKGTTTTTKLDPQQMVHWFVVSSYASGNFTEERVKNSVTLLQRVPPARFAVLHRFTLLFEEAIRAQLDQMEYQAAVPNINPDLRSSIELVLSTLIDLLNQNGEAWAPILCTWSVESLGQISSCYKQRQIVPPPSNLPKLLMFWLNITGMRMLLDVYRMCLKILIDHNPESWVESLLAASSNHSPYFDWVVADVGHALPDAIIEKVLHSGYDKFCKLRWTSLSLSSTSNVTMNENEQSVLTSVIRILEHLMDQHKKLICAKMLSMFKNPSDKHTGHIKVAYFLMNIFTLSQSLLEATTLVFVREINAAMLNTLNKEYQAISRSSEEFDTLCGLIVHLVCKSNKHSYKLVSLFVDAASGNHCDEFSSLDSNVKKIFVKILPSLLKDLRHLALSKSSDSKSSRSDALHELNEHYVDLCDSILSTTSSQRRTWLFSILHTTCLYRQASDILGYLLIRCSSVTELEIFLNLFNEIHPLKPGILEDTIMKSFTELSKITAEKRINLLKNIYHLMSQSGCGLVSELFTNRLKRSLCLVFDNLIDLLGKLSSSADLSSVTVQIIFALMSSIPSSKLRLATRMIPLTRTLVFYFYRLLHRGHVNNDQPMQSCQRALVELSQTHELFQVLCRFVLEAAVTKDNRSLFGSHIETNFNEDHFGDAEEPLSLLSVHRKLSSQRLSRRSMSGFVPISVETGLIGGDSKKRKRNRKTQTSYSSNNECLSLLIYRCCCKTSGGDDVSQLSIPDVVHAFDSDKLVYLSDCLISSITSSSPYLATALTLDGDLEWPALHMKKFTIERDLKVFHFLEEHSFVWQILFLIAHSYKALWNLSPVIRSCVSVLLTHFESSRYTSPPPQSSIHYKFAVKVVKVIEKGQLVPPPLCFVSELFDCVSPYEIFVLLSVIWNFIKDHPPQFDMESSSKDDRDFSSEKINIQPYQGTVHTILHANITKLGHLFSRFITA